MQYMAPHLNVAVWIILQVIMAFGSFQGLVLPQKIKPEMDIFQA